MTTNLQEVTQEIFNDYYNDYISSGITTDECIEWALGEAFRYAELLS